MMQQAAQQQALWRQLSSSSGRRQGSRALSQQQACKRLSQPQGCQQQQLQQLGRTLAAAAAAVH
jgi:hypothetical protein